MATIKRIVWRIRLGLARWLFPFDPADYVLVDTCMECGGLFAVDPAIRECTCSWDTAELRGVS